MTMLHFSILLCLFSFILGVPKSVAILEIVSFEILSISIDWGKYNRIFHIQDFEGLPFVLVR